MQTRRTLLQTVGIGVTAGLGLSGRGGARVTVPGNEQVDGSVRIGVVQPLSGDQEPYGRRAVQGVYTYFGYRGGDVPSTVAAGEETFEVDGTTYVVDVRESSSDAATATTATEDLQADAAAVIGGATAGTVSAIAERMVDGGDLPYLAGPGVVRPPTGEESGCARQVFQVSETPQMEATAGARYLATERDDVDSVYLYHAATDAGEAVKVAYQRVLSRNGVTVAGSQRLEQGYDGDWLGQFQQAATADVDAVVAGFSLSTLPSMLTSYLTGQFEFRFITGWGTSLFGDVVGSVLDASLGEYDAARIEDAGVGPFPTGYHWNQYDNDINDAAVETHRDAFGTNPDRYTAGAFAATSALVQAIEQSGTTQPTALVDELRGMTVEETLKGEDAYEFRASDNLAQSPATVAPVVPTADETYWQASVQPGSPVARLDAERVVAGLDEACALGPVDDGQGTENGNNSATTSTNQGGDNADGGDGSGEDGALGPLVAVAGLAGGLGAAWLSNRDDE